MSWLLFTKDIQSSQGSRSSRSLMAKCRVANRPSSEL